MNLAFKDIRHNLGRFVLTAVGIGLLLMTVMGMGGIYRGLVQDATLLIDRLGADLWVVQKDTRGPFAEVSRIPASLEDRVRTVPGVRSAGGFISHTVQREINGRPVRMTLQGLPWPHDRGQWLPIVAGRWLGQSHYEMIADQVLGFSLGEEVRIGRDTYTVVGLTHAMSSTSGDGMAFFTINDARAIQFDTPPEAQRLERSARHARAGRLDRTRTQPQLLEHALGPASHIPALGTPMVSAIVVHVDPAHDPTDVARAISGWPDTTVYTHQQQHDLLIHGTVDRARRQLGLFRTLLIIISAIIMALILYTLTLDKLHDIAMLKLMGARNGIILGLILQQAVLLGGVGYVIAYCVGTFVFPKFPRRVIIVEQDLWMLALIVLGISIAASLLGIARAAQVQPSEVIA